MRIPHHLVRARSGLWSFRQRVPVDLQPVIGRLTFKRTLRTCNMKEARLRALMLAASYAQAFAVLRQRRVEKLSKKEADELIARLTGTSLRDLTLHRTQAPDGTINERWQIDSPDDVQLYQQMMELTAAMDRRALPRPSLLYGPMAAAAPAPPPAPKPASETIALGKARDAWLASIKGSNLPKTWTIKKTAVEMLTSFLGEKTKIHAITRSDLARWYQHMRDGGASTPTLTNKQSYIGGKGGFFDWALASGYYPKGDNPANGHVSYSTREKRARRKFGFKAYDTHQVQVLFAPAAFESLPLPARWASLIGLYTGARASEVGQLLIGDVLEDGGVPCIQISDEGEHQRVKTDVSLRTVPVHPDLVALGLLKWIEGLRAEGPRPIVPRRQGRGQEWPRQLGVQSVQPVSGRGGQELAQRPAWLPLPAQDPDPRTPRRRRGLRTACANRGP